MLYYFVYLKHTDSTEVSQNELLTCLRKAVHLGNIQAAFRVLNDRYQRYLTKTISDSSENTSASSSSTESKSTSQNQSPTVVMELLHIGHQMAKQHGSVGCCLFTTTYAFLGDYYTEQDKGIADNSTADDIASSALFKHAATTCRYNTYMLHITCKIIVRQQSITHFMAKLIANFLLSFTQVLHHFLRLHIVTRHSN